MFNIICKNLKKSLARGLISHRGRHSFVTLLVTLAVTLSNQGRRTSCGFELRSGAHKTHRARSALSAQIFLAHLKSCSSCGTKTRHTHTITCTMETKANHEQRVCLLLLLFAHHHYYLRHYHHHRCHSHWEWGLSCATSSV